MADAATLETRAPVSVEVRSQRRTYPLPPTPAAPSSANIYELRSQDEEQTLAQRLRVSLWARLPWSTLSESDPDRQTLIDCYVASLTVLRRCQSDIEALVRTACETSLEFRQETGETNEAAREAAIAERLRETLERIGTILPPLPNVLDTTVVSQLAPIVQTRLDAALRAAVERFSTDLFELFARLVDQEVFGLVEWHPNHCCSYHFFKRVVIQENDGAYSESYDTLLEDMEDDFADGLDDEDDFGAGLDDNSIGRNIIGTRTTRIVRGSGQHTHRLARHEHGVMNAIRTSIANSRVVMPLPVQRLVETIPGWLEPFVQVIDGQIFRERIIERDLTVTRWEDVEVRDEPIFGCEPAVIVGSYVLTGWGPREVAAEEARRAVCESQARENRTRLQADVRFPIFAGTAAVLAVISLILFTLAHRGQASTLVAMISTVTAICATWQAALCYAVRERLPKPMLWTHLMTAAIASPLFVLEWLIARWFQPLDWLTPVMLIVGAIVCLGIANFVETRRSAAQG